MIRIAEIVNDSIVDGPGLRVAVFVQGCPHRCEGCHNPKTHDFNGGKLVSAEEIIEIISNNPLATGVTFTGGEPMCQAAELLPVALFCKKNKLNTAIYTGYTFEEVLAEGEKSKLNLLKTCDVLVDGRFTQSERSLNLRFKGSSNQRVLDPGASLTEGEAVFCADERWL